MYPEIGSFDAKTRLPELLRKIAAGRAFTITLRGHPVADLVPSAAAVRVDAEAAVAALRAMPKLRLNKNQSIKSLIAQGRR